MPCLVRNYRKEDKMKLQRIMNIFFFPKPHLKRFYFLTLIDVTLSNQQLRATFHSTHVEHMHLWCAHRDILERLHVCVRNRFPTTTPHCAHRQHVWKCFCTALVEALKQVRERLCAYVHTANEAGMRLPARSNKHAAKHIISFVPSYRKKFQKKEKNQQIKRQSNTRISGEVSGTGASSELKA